MRKTSEPTTSLAPEGLDDLIEASGLDERSVRILKAIAEAHKPEQPPEGQQWLMGGQLPMCLACGGGDPYLAEVWPCSAVQPIIDELEA